jgi:membrane dipeptidase
MLGQSLRSSTKRDEERARALHARATVFDAHSDIGVDILRRRMRGATGILGRMRHQLKRGGITGALLAVWADSESYSCGGYGQTTSTALRSIGFVKEEIEACRGWALQARSVEDIRRAKKQAKTAFIFHLEGAMPLDEDLAYVRVFRELGVLSVGPVWNIRNQVADGIEQRANSGLTNFGTMLVSELDRSRVAIDVSHLSEKGFWDVMALSRRPVIASHSNARALCDNPRNLKDDQIRAIAENSGVIGACFYSPFIDAKKPSLNRLLDHIDYIADLVGVNHIGLGADFTDYLAEETAKTPSPSPMTSKAASNRHPRGIENASKMLNVTRGLVSRGYSDQEIFKILGENFLRVLRQVWGS